MPLEEVLIPSSPPSLLVTRVGEGEGGAFIYRDPSLKKAFFSLFFFFFLLSTGFYFPLLGEGGARRRRWNFFSNINMRVSQRHEILERVADGYCSDYSAPEGRWGGEREREKKKRFPIFPGRREGALYNQKACLPKRVKIVQSILSHKIKLLPFLRSAKAL